MEETHTVTPIELFQNFSKTAVDTRPSRAPVRCPVGGCHKLLARRYQLITHIKRVHKADPRTVIVDEESRPVDISVSVVCGGGGNDNLSPPTITNMTRKSSRVRVKCPYEGCGKTVVDRQYLLSHIKRVHNVDPQDVLPEKPIPERVGIARRKASTVSHPTNASTSKLVVQPENMDVQIKSEVVSVNEDDTPPSSKRSKYDEEDNASQDGVLGGDLQPFKCPFDGCTRQTFRKHHIQRHLEQVHKVTNPKEFFPRGRRDRDGNIPSGDPIMCGFEGCGTVLGRRTDLNRHIKNVHKGDPLEWEVIYPPPLPSSTPSSTTKNTSKRKRTALPTPSLDVEQSIDIDDLFLATHVKVEYDDTTTPTSASPAPFKLNHSVSPAPIILDHSTPPAPFKLGHDKAIPLPTREDKDKGYSEKPPKFRCPYKGCGKMLHKDYRYAHIRNVHKADPKKVLGHYKKLPPNVLLSRRRSSLPPQITTASAATNTTQPNNMDNKIKKEVVRDDDNVDCVSTPKRYQCPVEGCLTKMDRTNHIKVHIKGVHKLDPTIYFPPKGNISSLVPVRCGFEGCGKVLSRKTALDLHIREVHKGDPREWELVDLQQEKRNKKLLHATVTATTTTIRVQSQSTKKLEKKMKQKNDDIISSAATHVKLEYDTTVKSAPSSPSNFDEDMILGF